MTRADSPWFSSSWFVVGCAGVVALGVAGYLLGVSSAPTDRDATEAKRTALIQARAASKAEAFSKSAARGRVAGHKAGVLNSRAEAGARGARAGGSGVESQLALIAEEEAEVAEQAEAEERAENCGAPLFVDGYCPTDEEIEREGLAESLCGPGDAAHEVEAAEQGIECRPAIDRRSAVQNRG